MPISRQNAALVSNNLIACSIMPSVKHGLTKEAKHRLLFACESVFHHKAMLKDDEAERMAIAQRVAEAIAACSSKTAVANACNVTDQAVTGWLKTGRINKKHFPVIAKMSGYQLAWLLSGEGPKHVITGTMRASLTPDHVPLAPQMCGNILPSGDHNVSPGPNIRGHVPLISWVHAGSWEEAIDLYHPGDASEWITCPASHGPHTYALRVEGDSMTAPHGKSYPSGCIIFVDPDQRCCVPSGTRVIAKANGDNAVTFKVYVEDAGRRFLKPLNPQYPLLDGEFRILGRVIGKWEPE